MPNHGQVSTANAAKNPVGATNLPTTFQNDLHGTIYPHVWSAVNGTKLADRVVRRLSLTSM